MSYHPPILNSDQTNMSDLKDIKDLITTTTTTNNESWDDILNPVPSGEDGMIGLLDAYCKMHNKLEFHVSSNERSAMGKMVAGGTPNPFTIQTMASLLEAKRIREGDSFKLPKSFYTTSRESKKLGQIIWQCSNNLTRRLLSRNHHQLLVLVG